MKKNILLSVFVLSVLVLSFGMISATLTEQIYDNEAATFVRINHDNGQPNQIVTNEVKLNDELFAYVDDREELQGKWEHNIPSSAVVTSAEVIIEARETTPEIEFGIQLWSANKEKLLTSIVSLEDSHSAKIFSDSKLTTAIQNMISKGYPILLEADFDEVGIESEVNAQAEIDYMLLKITYTVDEVEPEVSISKDISNPTCENNVKITATANDDSDLESFKLVCGNSAKEITSNAAVNGNSATLSDTLSVPSYTPELLFDNSLITCTATAKDIFGNEKVEVFTYRYDCEAPSVDFTFTSGIEGTPVNFAFTGGDTVSSNSDLDYAWDFGNGVSSDEENPGYSYMDDGTYSVTLTVTDEAGNFTTLSQDVVINDLTPTAVLDVSKTIDEGQTVTFECLEAWGNSADLVSKCVWTFEDGTSKELASGESFIKEYLTDETFTEKLIITDEDSDSIEYSMDIIVNDLTPTANAGSDQSVMENDLVQFDSSASTNPTADMIQSWSWDFGNGVSSTKENPTYAYLEDGEYTVALTVIDEDGDISIDTMKIIVTNHKPVFVNLPETMNIVTGETFTYDVDFIDASTMDSHIFSLVDAEDGVSIDSTTGVISWNPIDSQVGTHTVTVELFDGTDTITEDLTINVFDYKISLAKDWNLISIPLVAENDDTSVGSVFSSVSGKVEVIWSYAWDESQHKNVWTYKKMSDETGTLTNIKPGYGYYVKMTESADLFLNGKNMYNIGSDAGLAMPPSVTLATNSWNLIGKYGLETKSKSYALDSLSLDGLRYYNIIYDSTGSHVDNLVSSNGYWLSIGLPMSSQESIEYNANY